MVNKQNVALALGKIEEIEVLLEDVAELIEHGWENWETCDKHISCAIVHCRRVGSGVVGMKDNLKEAMNEN